MSMKVVGCELTKMKATHPATTVSNIMLSNPSMINTKYQCPSDITTSNPLESCTKPYSKCSIIFSKIILSMQSKQQSHQAQLLITSQLSSYKINLYTHGRISDNSIRQSTNPHIVIYPKIISHPSPCKINPRLKLLTLYLVRSKKGYAKLEQLGMEKSYNGVKGEVV